MFTDLAPNDPASFSSSDILATSLLDVPFLPRAVRSLLAPEPNAINELLTAVPDDVDLWNATDEDLEPAYRLWSAVMELEGVGRTRASKLVARKLPRLIPVIDDVLRVALDIRDDDDTWDLFRGALADSAHGLLELVESFRPSALNACVTPLRVLDAALWMNLSRSRYVALVGGGPLVSR